MANSTGANDCLDVHPLRRQHHGESISGQTDGGRAWLIVQINEFFHGGDGFAIGVDSQHTAIRRRSSLKWA